MRTTAIILLIICLALMMFQVITSKQPYVTVICIGAGMSSGYFLAKYLLNR